MGYEESFLEDIQLLIVPGCHGPPGPPGQLTLSIFFNLKNSPQLCRGVPLFLPWRGEMPAFMADRG